MTYRITAKLRPADVAWLVLWAWVFGYNTWAAHRRRLGDESCEQLSEACDRYLATQRWPTELWLAAFYIHLANKLPERFDLIHWWSLALTAAVPGRASTSRSAPDYVERP